MCYQPLQILNRRIDFRPEVDRMGIQVPCGHCLECIENKEDDWYVRLYYEKRRHKDGCILFPTLTFDEYDIPVCDSAVARSLSKRSDLYIPDFRFYSFDKRTVQNFLKKLRVNLDRCGIDSEFKYFIVCEYGHDNEYIGSDGKKHKGTIRPHYHLLLFFSQYVSDFKLRDIMQFSWSHSIKADEVPESFKRFAEIYFNNIPQTSDFFSRMYVPHTLKGDNCRYVARLRTYNRKDGTAVHKIQYLRKRGNVSYSKDYGAYVQCDSALKYVTKYIFKHDSFYSLDSVQTVKEILSSLPKLSNLTPEDSDYDLVRYLNNVFPFRLNSIDFGGSLFDELQSRAELAQEHDKVMREILLPNRISLDNDNHFYHIPQYILNRLFYYYEDRQVLNISHHADNYFQPTITSYRKRLLSPLGAECVKLRAKLKLDALSRFYANYVSSDFQDLVAHMTLCDEDKDKYEYCINFVRSHPVNVRLLAAYSLFYQGALLSSYKQVDFSTFSEADFILHGLEMDYYRVNTYNASSLIKQPSPIESPYVRDFFDKDGYFCNLPVFNGFDEYLTVFNTLKCIISKYTRTEEFRKQKLADHLRQYYINLKYK